MNKFRVGETWRSPEGHRYKVFNKADSSNDLVTLARPGGRRLRARHDCRGWRRISVEAKAVPAPVQQLVDGELKYLPALLVCGELTPIDKARPARSKEVAEITAQRYADRFNKMNA